MNICNVYVDPVCRGAMMNLYLVVIGDGLTALLGIAGDVGDSNGPPARRGIMSLRLGEQLKFQMKLYRCG